MLTLDTQGDSALIDIEAEPLEPIRTVFMGTPQFAVPALTALMDAGCDVVGVYTQPDRRSGRGRRRAASPVKQAASERGLPVFQPTSLRRDAAARAQIAALEPHLIVVAAYGLFLPPDTLRLPPLGALNIHPSLLPRYRGPSPVAAAMLADDAATGVTVIQLDEGMDSGPILAQTETPIGATETADALTARLFEMGAALLADILPKWRNGDIAPAQQDECRATITRLLSREDGAIDWHMTAAQIARQARAYHPWPGSFTHWRGQLLKVLECSPLPSASDSPPGRVVALPDGVGAATGEGVLALRRLQLEGRQAVGASEFVQGYSDFIGSTLGDP